MDDLGSLIEPILPNDFMGTYWERSPLLVPGRSRRYGDLFSLADVDRLISEGKGRHPLVRTAKAHSPKGSNGQAPANIYDAYRDGATIVLHAVHEVCPALTELCRTLTSELSAALHVNAYLTPANAQGLPAHYDTHDVFVLQIEGTKHWRLWAPPLRLPLRSQPFDPASSLPDSPPREFDLTPGDLLYLPRGFLHDAVSEGATSLHLTVGVHPVTWAAVLLEAIGERIRSEPRLRESLTPGFADDPALQSELAGEFVTMLRRLADRIDAPAAIGNAVEQVLAAGRASRDGRLLDIEAAAGIDETTYVRRRPGIHWTMSCADEVTLRFEDKLMRLPGHTAPQLRFITASDVFTAADLPGALDAAGRLVLVRRLVEEGFLTVQGANAETRPAYRR